MTAAPAAAAPAPTGAPSRAARALAGWRGPALAAVVAGLAGLPGLLAVPPLDRDESRFAQASAQMLERGDPVNIRFQGEPRNKKPVGIHWLQAASVALTSSTAAREIAAYRWPSLAGAMLAAAACAWGMAAFVGPEEAALAGVLLAACTLLSTEAFIAKTDAVLCGATTLALAALGRRYAAARGGSAGPRAALPALWAGIALATLDKGPVGPMVAGLALLALWAADRDAAWMRRLAWGRGLAFTALVCGPWAVAVTVATDGAFWTGAVGGDLAPKLAGGHQGHGAPPGVHALLAPLLFFPATLLLPGGAVSAWKRRREPGVRFALAWLLPSWIVFELLPTKLPHYPLPMYGALAWLCVLGLPDGTGRQARRTGAALAAAAALVFTALPLLAASRYGGPGDWVWAAVAAGLAAGAGAAGAAGLLAGRARGAAVAALALGVGAHAALTAGLLPRLDPLWTSLRVARELRASGLDPRGGLTPGPVAVAGYAEPSLVFLLGTPTELATPAGAARAVAEGRPALVEARVEPTFRAALGRSGTGARMVARVSGYDYSDGRPVALTLWRADAPPSPGARPVTVPPPAPRPARSRP